MFHPVAPYQKRRNHPKNKANNGLLTFNNRDFSTKHPPVYYTVRSGARFIFWGVFFFAPIWALIVLVG
jgi:hypothetical protein